SGKFYFGSKFFLTGVDPFGTYDPVGVVGLERNGIWAGLFVDLYSFVYTDKPKNIVPGDGITTRGKFVFQLLLFLSKDKDIVFYREFFLVHIYRCRMSSDLIFEKTYKGVAVGRGKILYFLIVNGAYGDPIK